jgi:hypothetical protein
MLLVVMMIVGVIVPVATVIMMMVRHRIPDRRSAEAADNRADRPAHRRACHRPRNTSPTAPVSSARAACETRIARPAAETAAIIFDNMDVSYHWAAATAASFSINAGVLDPFRRRGERPP